MATIPVVVVERLQALGLQVAATLAAVREGTLPLGKTTAAPQVTKAWLTIEAMISARRGIMTATMDELLYTTIVTMIIDELLHTTIMTMIIVTTVTDISSTVCGSGMAPRMLLTTAVG